MVQADGIIANADKVDDLDGPIVCYAECLCPPTPLATICDWRRHAFDVFFDIRPTLTVEEELLDRDPI